MQTRLQQSRLRIALLLIQQHLRQSIFQQQACVSWFAAYIYAVHVTIAFN